MLQTLDCTALKNAPPRFHMIDIFGAQLKSLKIPLLQRRITLAKPLVVEAKAKARRGNTRTENAKTRNRRIRKKMMRERKAYLKEALHRDQYAAILHVPPLKLLDVLVKSLSRVVKSLILMRFRLMIAMVSLVEKECKPLRLQFPHMGSYYDRSQLLCRINIVVVVDSSAVQCRKTVTF